MNILVTGGSGFIGSSLIENLFKNTNHNIINLDKLTYASLYKFPQSILNSKRYTFKKIDICSAKITNILKHYKPDTLVHLAAESHVDNSISSPTAFIDTNIYGTYNLLRCTLKYFNTLDTKKKNKFKFINFSTDEVFGDLADHKYKKFTENTPYNPSSPYSASKASADHLVKAWNRTYNLPAIILNSSNNYGPKQHHEKLIPLTIKNALSKKTIPIYGNGLQKRDWIYVEDCTNAIIKVINFGISGFNYNIGSRNVIKNIDLVKKICAILDKIYPQVRNTDSQLISSKSYLELIKHVDDRPGHDIFYAINPKKFEKEMDWKPLFSLKDGLLNTVKWYLKFYNEKRVF